MIIIPLLALLYNHSNVTEIQEYVEENSRQKRLSDRNSDFEMPETDAQMFIATTVVEMLFTNVK
jgi:hypothetical protein